MTSNGGATSTTSSSSSSIPFFGNNTDHLPTSRAIAASTFLAGDEAITIIPSFTLRAPLSLLSSSNTVGPFRAGMDTTVPLWLGTMLRRRKLARIVPPSWMDIDTLRRVLHYERDVRQANFSPDLPFRHAEMARAILSACGAGAGSGCSGGGGSSSSAATAGFDTAGGEEGGIEIPDADAIKLLLEDIANVRMDKIRRNVHQLSSSVLTVRTRSEIVIDVTNIGSLEMASITPYVLESFKLYRELSGRGSTYSKDVGELIPSSSSSSSSSSSNNNVSSSGSSSSTSANNATSSSGTRGGRLQQSRLARESSQFAAPPPPRGENETIEEKEEEELEIPRPMEEDIDEDAHEEDLRMADDDDEEKIDPPGDAAARGRSRLRRHR